MHRLSTAFIASFLAAFVACSGSGSPSATGAEATWSSSREAQRDFRRLVARWSAVSAPQRVALEPMFLDFLERYQGDARTRAAGVYLAWIYVQKGQLAEARRLSARASKGHSGVVYDFASVVEGAILIRQKMPQRALAVLEPLRGKIIDPAERLLFGGELVRAALLAKRYDSAIGYMVDWVEQAPTSEVETVQMEIEGLLREAPVKAIESGLSVLESEAIVEAENAKSTRAAARAWLKKTVRTRLVNAALADRDASLAKRLLDATPPSFRRDDTAEALALLAAEGRVEPRVHGRAVGIVLRLADDVSRRRSSQIITGISRGLGLPEAASDPEAVRLVTEDGSEGDGAIEESLAALAGEGAAILVAALGEDESVKAAAFAERAKIPVLLLSDSAALDSALDFTFVLGIDQAKVNEAQRKSLADHQLRSPIVIGPGGVRCRGALANEPPFPVADWKKNGVDALLLLGDLKCSRDAIAEIDRQKLPATAVLGLESAELYSSLPNRALLVSSAGHFPSGIGSVPTAMRQWQARAGAPPSWYEALGHDAATLVAKVLSAFPLDRFDDAKKVAEMHRKARDALSTASCELWTTDQKGFAGARRLMRDLRLISPRGPSR